MEHFDVNLPIDELRTLLMEVIDSDGIEVPSQSQVQVTEVAQQQQQQQRQGQSIFCFKVSSKQSFKISVKAMLIVNDPKYVVILNMKKHTVLEEKEN